VDHGVERLRDLPELLHAERVDLRVLRRDLRVGEPGLRERARAVASATNFCGSVGGAWPAAGRAVAFEADGVVRTPTTIAVRSSSRPGTRES
jgi:hypothetical protein